MLLCFYGFEEGNDDVQLKNKKDGLGGGFIQLLKCDVNKVHMKI